MSKLLKALKEKYKSPKDAVQALGLDSSLLDGDSPAPNNSGGVGSKLMELITMTKRKNLLSRKAAMAKGAIAVCLQPRLAQDAKIDLITPLMGVTHANWKTSKAKIVDAMKKMSVASFIDKPAMDAGIADVVKLLDNLDGEQLEEGAAKDVEVSADPAEMNPADKQSAAVPLDADPAKDSPLEAIMNLLKGKISDEDLAQVQSLLEGQAGDDADGDGDVDAFMSKLMAKMKGGTPAAPAKPAVGATGEEGAEDSEAEAGLADNNAEVGKGSLSNAALPAPTNGTDPQKEKTAMDKAIKMAKDEATAAAVKRMRDIQEAEKAVKPLIGEVTMACDTADAVYRLALDEAGIDVTGVHPSAFKSMVAMLVTNKANAATQQKVPTKIGMDSKTVAGFKERYPTAGSVRTL